jgi:hypothetical protein
MVGGLKAISSAHSAKAGAQAAMEYARAAQAAVHPYVYGQVPASYGAMSPQARSWTSEHPKLVLPWLRPRILWIQWWF